MSHMPSRRRHTELNPVCHKIILNINFTIPYYVMLLYPLFVQRAKLDTNLFPVIVRRVLARLIRNIYNILSNI